MNTFRSKDDGFTSQTVSKMIDQLIDKSNNFLDNKYPHQQVENPKKKIKLSTSIENYIKCPACFHNVTYDPIRSVDSCTCDGCKTCIPMCSLTFQSITTTTTNTNTNTTTTSNTNDSNSKEDIICMNPALKLENYFCLLCKSVISNKCIEQLAIGSSESINCKSVIYYGVEFSLLSSIYCPYCNIILTKN